MRCPGLPPAWRRARRAGPVVLAASVLTGASAGMLDAGLNTAVALTGRARLLNLLHGFYGVGTAIGPLVITAAILTGYCHTA